MERQREAFAAGQWRRLVGLPLDTGAVRRSGNRPPLERYSPAHPLNPRPRRPRWQPLASSPSDPGEPIQGSRNHGTPAPEAEQPAAQAEQAPVEATETVLLPRRRPIPSLNPRPRRPRRRPPIPNRSPHVAPASCPMPPRSTEDPEAARADAAGLRRRRRSDHASVENRKPRCRSARSGCRSRSRSQCRSGEGQRGSRDRRKRKHESSLLASGAQASSGRRAPRCWHRPRKDTPRIMNEIADKIAKRLAALSRCAGRMNRSGAIASTTPTRFVARASRPMSSTRRRAEQAREPARFDRHRRGAHPGLVDHVGPTPQTPLVRPRCRQRNRG